jgi:O-antigen/teichoic acid export membrane protein
LVTTRETLIANEGVARTPHRTFTSQVAWTLGSRLLMAASSFATGVIVARRLGSAGVGVFSVLTVTLLLAVQVSGCGVPLALTRFIAQDRRRLKSATANAILFAMLTGGALAILISVLSFLGVTSLFDGIPQGVVVVVAIAIPFQLANLLVLHALLGADEIRRFNLLETLAPVLMFLSACVALWLGRGGLLEFFMLNTAACIGLTICAAPVIGRVARGLESVKPARLSVKFFNEMRSGNWGSYVLMLAPVFLFRMDLLLLKALRGAAEAGVYAIASQAAMTLMLAPLAISTILLPRAAAPDEGNARNELTATVTRHAAFVMLILCVVTAPLALLLPFVYGVEFADATAQLLVLLPGVCMIGIALVIVQHFNASSGSVAVPAYWVLTLIVNFALNFALASRFGGRGAAVASTASYALIFTLIARRFCLETKTTPRKLLVLRAEELCNLLTAARRATL